MKKIDDVVSTILSYKMGLREQEEKLKTFSGRKKFKIGIPKEDDSHEKCVPLTPELTESLVNDGYKIVIEKNAGLGAGFSDMEYSNCGATIVSSTDEVYKSDVIVKINHPLEKEIEMMPKGGIVVSNIYRTKPTAGCLNVMMKHKITGISAELVTNEYGWPIRDSLFPLEGKALMLMASELLTNERGGQGVLLGGIAGVHPAEIVIIGAGIVAEHAAQVGIVLGATVKIFSASTDSLFSIKQRVGQSLYTNMLNTRSLLEALSTADVVINTLNFERNDDIFRVGHAILSLMKRGAIVLDMSVHCAEYDDSKMVGIEKYVLEKYGVTYHCIINISSRVARTASMALSNIVYDIIRQVTRFSNITEVLQENKGIREGVYTFNGFLIDAHLGQIYRLPYQNINLLLSAF